MCFPDGIWSHSGNVLGSNTLSIGNAQGPGALGSAGDGVWVQSKLNLALFIGQRVKIRWIANIWEFGVGWNSYMEPPAGTNPFDIGTADDGWWVDGIQLTGAITTPASPVLEPTTIPLTIQCPASAAANCDQSLGSNGFTVNFTLDDTDGDGVISPGEEITLDASQTLNPGGCADGVPQFRFSRINGPTTVIQDWSTAASIKLSNEVDGDNFGVEVRCSSDFSCTSALTSPPSGSGACAPGGLRMGEAPVAPCVTGENLVPGQCAAGFTAWSFGAAACGALGAPGSLICATTHNWEHHIDPDTFPPHLGRVCHARVPALWGNAFVSTGPLPVVPPPLLLVVPWNPIPIASASCNVPGGALNTCDVDGAGFFAVPPGALPADFTCGDSAIPPVGTVTFYEAGYSGMVAGAACTAVGPNFDAPAPQDCYRWDAAAALGLVLGPACP